MHGPGEFRASLSHPLFSLLMIRFKWFPPLLHSYVCVFFRSLRGGSYIRPEFLRFASFTFTLIRLAVEIVQRFHASRDNDPAVLAEIQEITETLASEREGRTSFLGLLSSRIVCFVFG